MVDGIRKLLCQPPQQFLARQSSLLGESIEGCRIDRGLYLMRLDWLVGPLLDPGIDGVAAARISESIQHLPQGFACTELIGYVVEDTSRLLLVSEPFRPRFGFLPSAVRPVCPDFGRPVLQ